MTDDISEQLERLTSVNERIADSLERVGDRLDEVASEVFSIKLVQDRRLLAFREARP